MPLPELVRAVAEKKLTHFCSQRIPEHTRDQVRLEYRVRGNSITLLEKRPPWRVDFGPEWTELPIAQMRYGPATGEWSLFWADRNSRWLPYRDLEPARDLQVLIDEIDQDPFACFWG
jgi:hypothetical protein